ncbi:uncharacterized protein LOC111064075 [Nilaparvata lugens]|uniref:uncharacterized protein LOC111064075 n=1 Tax=Nilaparvata lugens TaxID=108931 RepID=UPI00193E911C|nr:uncharacterized protein LOC111064075 [Nilaparvata lugens]
MSANFCFLVTCVVKKLEAEIWILRQYIRSIDSKISEDDKKQFYEISLKRYINLCIKYHQAILSSIRNVNSAISFMMFPFNNVIAVIVGMKLYFLMESTGSLYNITDVGSAFFTFAIICFMGQGLTDESEQLFHDFTMCNWIEKPYWFKKSVTICMTCSIRLLGLRTALYTINLTNVVKVLQATYSYVNLLWKLK